MFSSVFSFLFYILAIWELEVAAEFRHDYSYENDTDTYYKAHLPKPWMDAVMVCAAEGAVLGSPSNYLEARIMEQVFISYGLVAPLFWIGISSMYAEKSNDTYKSVDGTPMENILQTWKKNHPTTGTINRCVALRTRSLELENIACNVTKNFVCQHRNKTDTNMPLDLINVTSTYVGYTSVTGSMDSMIKVHNDKADYLTAMQICAREGSKLGGPLNAIEHGIYKLLLNENAWVGIYNQKFDPTQKSFRYVDENLGPNPYFNWLPSNPVTESLKWFVALTKEGLHFNDKGEQLSSYICAKDKLVAFHNNPLNFPVFNSSASSSRFTCECF